MELPPKGLAEIAVWYSIAIIASAFLVLFVMAGLSEIRGVNVGLCFLFVLLAWLATIGISTRKLVRSELVTKSTASLAPLYTLQAVLVIFTVPHAMFAASDDWRIWSGILLVWEVWGVVFTLSFLFLAALARKHVGIRTWAASALSTLIVCFSVYRRL